MRSGGLAGDNRIFGRGETVHVALSFAYEDDVSAVAASCSSLELKNNAGLRFSIITELPSEVSDFFGVYSIYATATVTDGAAWGEAGKTGLWLNLTSADFADCGAAAGFGLDIETTSGPEAGYYAFMLNLEDEELEDLGRALVRPQLQALGATILNAVPGSALSINDLLWVVVSFTGKVDDPLPAGCVPSLALNFATNTTLTYVPRATALEQTGASEEIINDRTLVLSKKIAEGDQTSAATIGVQLPVAKALRITGASCKATGMVLDAASAAVEKRDFSAPSNPPIKRMTPDSVEVTDFYLHPVRSYEPASSPKLYISGVSVDTLPSTLSQVSSKKAAGAYYAGDIIDIFVSFNRPVSFFLLTDGTSTTYGKPYLDVNTGGVASFIGHAPRDTATLVFRYVVGSGEATPQDSFLEVTAFVLNGGLISSPNGLDAKFDLPRVGSPSGLSASRISVNRSSSIVSLRVFGAVGGGADVFSVGDIVRVLASFDDTVDDASLDADGCSPTLATSIGTFARVPRDTFNKQISGTVAGPYDIVFERAVSESDGVIDSIAVSKPYDKAMSLDGCPASSRIRTPVQLGKARGFYPLLASSDGLAADIRTDTVPATVVGVTSKLQNNSTPLGPGDAIDILVAFSKPVKFGLLTDPILFNDFENKNYDARRYGTPRLILNAPAYAYLMGYANADAKTALLFRYIVSVGEGINGLNGTGPAFKYLDAMSSLGLDLYGGSITTLSNAIDANLELPVEPAPNSLFASRVSIRNAGSKIPPFGFDPDRRPGDQNIYGTKSFGVSGRRRTLLGVAANPNPTEVRVLAQFNSVFEVAERTQSYKADLSTVAEWFDPRFVTPTLPSVSENGTAILSSIWWPRLTVINLRERLQPFDQRVLIFNNGTVQMHERYVMAFSVSIDARKFPFDEQNFYVQIRSQTFDRTKVTFKPLPQDLIDIQESVLKNINEPAFSFSKYSQTIGTVGVGAFANHAMLTVSFLATRISTYNTINIILPLLFICISVCASFSMPIKSDARTATCTGALAATLAFAFVVATVSPPVNYITKIGRLVFQAYAFSIAGILIQTFLRYVVWVIDESSRKVYDDKNDERARIYDHILDTVLAFKRKMRAAGEGHLLAKVPFDDPADSSKAAGGDAVPVVSVAPSVDVLSITTQVEAQERPKHKTTAGVLPNPARLNGTNPPTLPLRQYFLLDFYWRKLQFIPLDRMKREQYLDNLIDANFFLRILFWLTFIISTACCIACP
eukprot:tig00000204_g17739.t1